VDSRVGTTFGTYKITGLLGKGGMGEVYQAYDTGKGRTVALKILADQYSQDETYRTRFEREAHAAAILQEPHVIPIHHWGEIDGSLYIDMRLVQGQTLHDLLERGPLEPSRAVIIIDQVAAALDAAHAEGLIHRDVKPQNIIVTPADFAYLVDFGIAETRGDTRLTTAGTQIGTFKYMAPERFSVQEATPAVDVYSLACVLYEALTGDAPFPADSLEQVIAAHVSFPPPRPSAVNPRVPKTFDEVIARGMAKEPDDRYGTSGALARAAQRALQRGGDAASAVNTMQAPLVFPPPAWHAGVDPQPGPSSSGPTVSLGAHERARRWLLPTVIAIAAALILGGIGGVIGMLASRNSGPVAGPSPTTGSTVAAPTPDQTQSPQMPSTPPPPAALPPLVSGPDNSSNPQTCDHGYSLPNRTGWGSHAGRGTPETSCYFASSVLTAYWNEYGNASRQTRTVAAPGAVDCNTVPGAQCSGPNFLMQCAAYGTDNWITCSGGNNARVYLY
jgi:serine/threonine protein kinase